MRTDEIVAALSSLPDIQITTSASHVRGYIPAINDSFQLVAEDVVDLKRIFAPYGDPAIQFAVRDEDVTRHLIVTTNDIVYSPASSDSQLDSAVRVTVTNAPHLVAYSEMMRDVERLAVSCERACERGGDINLDGLAGSFLLFRCFIMGALAFGLYPVRAMAWWQRGWNIVGDDIPLPPFRSDPTWDKLAKDADLVILAITSDYDAHESNSPRRTVTTGDFERLKTVMTPVQLDDEFLASWNSWIRIAPSTLSETLTNGIPEATFDINLYPDGAGSIDLKLEVDGILHALLQLRFLFSEHTMYLDEIRIADAARGTGLFQRLLFNTQLLTELLGLSQMRFLATGIGSYALARVGRYPQ